jgi:fatty acid-binding protein DegV
MTTQNIVVTADSGVNPVDESNMVSGLISSVNLNGTLSEGKRDVKEIDPDKIIEGRINGINYRTSSPIIDDYYQLYIKYLKQKRDIIHFCMSSGISEGSNNSALLVAQDLNEKYANKVYVIDSLTGAAGGTVLTEYTKYLVEKGYDVSTLIKTIEEIKIQVLSSYFVPDATGFIYSGRHKNDLSFKDKAKVCGATLMKNMHMNTRVDFDNQTGNLYFNQIYRGNVNKELLHYLKDIVNNDNVQEYDNHFVALVSMPTDPQTKLALINYLQELKYFKKIIVQRSTGVYNAYGCPNLNMVGLIRTKKQRY